jgi:hypothetical protein
MGEKNSHHKLKSRDVIKIRKLYSTGNYSQRKLAKMFNVTQLPICDIVNHNSWRNLL